jgi:hypothetical protein
MARTQEDDPVAMKQRFEPGSSGRRRDDRRGSRSRRESDVTVTHVLLTTSMFADDRQFLPATIGWGLPLRPPPSRWR